MARLAYLLVATLALATAACEKDNPAYCAPGDQTQRCLIDSGQSEPMGCTDSAQCTSANAMVCDVAGSRTCVQCVGTGELAPCTTAAPICEANACRLCKAHAECGSKACLPNGTCAAEGTVAYVEAGGEDNATCTKATPCSKLQKALDTGRMILKLHGTFVDGMTINRSVTILSDPDAKLTRSSGGPVLTLNNAINVEIYDLTIDRSQNQNDSVIQANAATSLTLNRVTVSNSRGNGITSLGLLLAINQSTIASNAQLGVSSSATMLKISGSMIRNNDGGGVLSMAASTFDITNTFLVHNGTPGTTGSSVGGASLNPVVGGGSRFEFNTVADNHLRNSGTLSAGVYCDVATVMLPNNLIVHNDVNGDSAASNANTIGACAYPTSSVATSATDYKFVNATTPPYDYKLASDSMAIDKATTASTVTFDFEGDPRPQGAAKDQGADEYKP